MSKPKIYIDSCCFIDMVKTDLNREDIEDQRKADAFILRKLCDASNDGEIELFTSIISVAECIHAGEDGDIDDETKELFERFLTSDQFVKLVETSIFIAEEARDLLWKHGIRLKGADGIHVASALDNECTEFLTTDGKLQKKILN